MDDKEGETNAPCTGQITRHNIAKLTGHAHFVSLFLIASSKLLMQPVMGPLAVNKKGTFGKHIWLTFEPCGNYNKAYFCTTTFLSWQEKVTCFLFVKERGCRKITLLYKEINYLLIYTKR